MIRGSFRHRVAIYVPETYDIGNEVESWSLLGNPMASVKVKEVTEEGATDLTVKEAIEFSIPYASSLEAHQRDVVVMFRGNEYDVKSVNNVNFRDRELRLLAVRSDTAQRVS